MYFYGVRFVMAPGLYSQDSSVNVSMEPVKYCNMEESKGSTRGNTSIEELAPVSVIWSRPAYGMAAHYYIKLIEYPDVSSLINSLRSLRKEQCVCSWFKQFVWKEPIPERVVDEPPGKLVQQHGRLKQ